MDTTANVRESVIGFWILFAVLLIGALVPVWQVELPALADYPNNMARMHIWAHLAESETLQRFYEIVPFVQPNSAMELIVPSLALAVPLDVAGKLFITLTFVLMVGGVLGIHYAVYRRCSLWPLLAFLFLYNRLFLWGFLGYLFGVGLALVAFGLWLRVRRGPTWALIFCSTVLATAVYLSHLYAFGIYGLMVLGYEVGQLVRERTARPVVSLQRALAGVQFSVPLLLFAFLTPATRAAGSSHWGDLSRKLEAPFTVTYNYHLVFDVLTLVVLGAAMAIGLGRRRVVLSKGMLWPLGFLAVAFAVMPDQLFSSFGADRRIPIAFVLLLVAVTDWRIGSVRWRRLLCASVAVLFAVRMTLIVDQWREADATYGPYTEAIDQIEPGSRLLVVVAHPGPQSLPPVPVFEIASLAVVRREAFVPSLFAFPEQAAGTLTYTPEYLEIVDGTPHHLVRSSMLEALGAPGSDRRYDHFREDVLRHYDFALVVNEEALPQPVPDIGEDVYVGEGFRLLRLER